MTMMPRQLEIATEAEIAELNKAKNNFATARTITQPTINYLQETIDASMAMAAAKTKSARAMRVTLA